MIIDHDGQSLVLVIDDATEYEALSAVFQSVIPDYHTGQDVKVELSVVRNFMENHKLSRIEGQGSNMVPALKKEHERLLRIFNQIRSMCVVRFTSIVTDEQVWNDDTYDD